MKSLAILARLPCFGFHGWLGYIPDRGDTTPENDSRCGHDADHDRIARRSLPILGDTSPGRPCDVVAPYAQHRTTRYRKDFNADMIDLAKPGSHYNRLGIDTAVRLVIEDGLPDRAASGSLWSDPAGSSLWPPAAVNPPTPDRLRWAVVPCLGRDPCNRPLGFPRPGMPG